MEKDYWDKDGRCVGLTALPYSCADRLEILESQPPGTPRPVQVCSVKTLPFLIWKKKLETKENVNTIRQLLPAKADIIFAVGDVGQQPLWA